MRKLYQLIIQTKKVKNYPTETVRKLLETDAVTAPTRNALEQRLRATDDYQPAFFDAGEFTLLDAICRRLIFQNDDDEFVNCAAFIDRSLNRNESNGWRYDELPPDAETFRRGLFGIDETAKIQFDAEFQELNDAQKDEILTAIQNETASGETWKTLSAKLFFEELLAKTVEVYYAHPFAQERIGYVGMADAPGWTRTKLNELEDREPRASGEED